MSLQAWKDGGFSPLQLIDIKSDPGADCAHAGMTRAEDCVHACPKFKGSIGPPALSNGEADRLLQRLVKVREV